MDLQAKAMFVMQHYSWALRDRQGPEARFSQLPVT